MDPLGLISEGLKSVPTPAGGIFPFIQEMKSDLLNQASTKDARNYNLKMWNMQNEYNSPSAQMQRITQAGLNPNLMYSQGSTGQAAPPASASPVHYNQPDSSKTEVLSALLASEQLENLRQSRINMAQQNETEKANTAYKESQADALATVNRWLFGVVPGTNIDPRGQLSDSDPLWLQTQKIKNKYIFQNASNVESMALLNSKLRPYNTTINDPYWIRMLANPQGGVNMGSNILDLIKGILGIK